MKNDTFTLDTVDTALCLMDELHDRAWIAAGFEEWFIEGGRAATRQWCIDNAPACSSEWEALDQAAKDDFGCFDFDFVPHWLGQKMVKAWEAELSRLSLEMWGIDPKVDCFGGEDGLAFDEFFDMTPSEAAHHMGEKYNLVRLVEVPNAEAARCSK